MIINRKWRCSIHKNTPNNIKYSDTFWNFRWCHHTLQRQTVANSKKSPTKKTNPSLRFREPSEKKTSFWRNPLLPYRPPFWSMPNFVAYFSPLNSTIVVNCWFGGARWFGIARIPLWKGLLLRGIPRICHHLTPEEQNTSNLSSNPIPWKSAASALWFHWRARIINRFSSAQNKNTKRGI